MSDQDDIFGNEPKPNQTNPGDPGTPPSDPFADKLAGIKNENGEQKYKDLNTALEALSASQQFIPQLQNENAELKKQMEEMDAKLKQMGNIEDFVNRVSPNQPATPPAEPATPVQPQGLGEEEIAKLLDQRLDQRNQTQREQENYATVVGKLTESYGDKAGEVIRQRAKELNTTPEALRDIAKSNPTMAMNLLGGVELVKSPAPSPSETNSPFPKPVEKELTIEKGKGIAHGGYTDKQLTDFFRKSAEITNKRLGVES